MGAVRFGLSGTTSASRPSVSTPGRAVMPAVGSSTSTMSPSRTRPRSSTSLCKGGGGDLYLVRKGRAVFELDGDRVAAPAGTFVFAPPGVKRTAFAEEPETTVLALGGTPGKAYDPDGWELWAPLTPLYEAGEYAEAADRGRELVAAHPQYAGLLYNLACCESLAGRTVDALDHLGRAIDCSEQSRSYAKDDPDFDPIRDEPGFKELLAR